jgi:hypothetical protein
MQQLCQMRLECMQKRRQRSSIQRLHVRKRKGFGSGEKDLEEKRGTRRWGGGGCSGRRRGSVTVES